MKKDKEQGVETLKYIKQLGSDTIIYGISGTIGRLIGIFLVPLYTRVFSPSDYGIIAIIDTFVGLMGMLTILGMDNSSSRWFFDTGDIMGRKRVISSWFWFQSVAGLMIAFIIFILDSKISYILLGTVEYSTLICLVSLTIPLATFNKVTGNWLRYQRRPWTTTYFFTFDSLSKIGFIVLLVILLHQGLVGLYKAYLISAVCLGLVSIAILKTWISPQHICLKRLKEMLVFAMPLAPAGIASWVTSSSDRFILKMFTQTSEVGLYAIAAALASGVGLVTGAFQMAWGPFAFSILDKRDSLYVYSKVFSIYTLFGCFICTVISLFASRLLYLFTTPLYYGAASSVPYLVFAYLIMGYIFIVSIGSSIVKKSTPIATSIFIGAGVNIVLNFMFIPYLGKDGAAVSTLIAYICSMMYLYFASQKVYPIPYQFKDALICFTFSWILIILARLIPHNMGVASFIIRAALCCLFLPLALWLRIIRSEHLKLLFLNFGRHLRSAGT